MTNRERAIDELKKGNFAHIIYGYRAKGETIETGWQRGDMKCFYDDDTFCAYVDKMQATIDGLEMIYAVHA